MPSSPSERNPPTEAMLMMTPPLSFIHLLHAACDQKTTPFTLTWNVLS